MRKFRLTTPYGAAYYIHDNGDIERTDIKGFTVSGDWKMRGLQHVKKREFVPFRLLDEALGKFHLLYKNGHPQWTVADLDHGTNRTWGNTNHHGVKTITRVGRAA